MPKQNVERAIVFLTKEPKAGKVKTRLAEDIGEENAMKVHEILVFHCVEVALSSNVPVVVALQGDLDSFFAKKLREIGCILIPQKQGDLGEKIYAVFSIAQQVAVLGTDTPNIQREELLESLHATKITIGPAKDGGYWLIAGSNPPREIFENIPWSTDQVLQKTQIQLQYKDLTCQYLSMKQDIDYFKDLHSFLTLPSPYPSLQERLKPYARSKRIP